MSNTMELFRAVKSLAYPAEPGGKPLITQASGIALLYDLALLVDVTRDYSCDVTQQRLAQDCATTARIIGTRLHELRAQRLVSQKRRFGQSGFIALNAPAIFAHYDAVKRWLEVQTSQEEDGFVLAVKAE